LATSERRASLISRIAFSGDVEPELLGTIRLLDFNSVLEDLNPDMAFVYDNCIFADFFHKKNFFVMPEIDFSLKISGSWEFIIQQMCRTKRKMMRQIEKLGYECEITRDFEKLKVFYNDMYKPHLHEKYGKCANAVSFDVAQKHLLNGGLVLTKLNGEYVSGGIYYIRGDRLFVPLLSFKQSHESSSHSAGLALLHFLILLGKGKGCSRIDYEGAFPSFNYGLFRYKQTCGMNINVRKGWDADTVAVQFNNFDEGVRDFVSDTPFVFEDVGLKGLAIVDSKVNLKSAYNVPGLSSLVGLCSKNYSCDLEEQGGIPISVGHALDPSLRSFLKLAMQKNYDAFELDFKNNVRLHSTV